MTRERLPDTRRSITHKCVINAKDRRVKLSLIAGLYPDGRPGELFIYGNDEDSATRGVLHAMASFISLLLQTGTPIEKIAEKIAFSRFEPAGFTENPDIPNCSSLTDYIGCWLIKTFPRKEADTHQTQPVP